MTLRVEGGRILDEETGSEWTVSGQAISGELTGFHLDIHPRSMVAFWFAWTSFHPSTELWIRPEG